MTLVVLSTHPVQYHAPVYRELQAAHNIPVTAIYGSDFSVVGYQDAEFGVQIAWDSDLLSGYSQVFLTSVANDKNVQLGTITIQQVTAKLREVSPSAVLLQGYQGRYAWTTFRAACQYGAPLLFRAETTDHAVPRSWLKTQLRSLYLKWFYSHISVFLPIGSHSYQHYLGLGINPNRLVFAPYCVDSVVFRYREQDRSELRPATRHLLGLDNNTIAVLFSGKLTEHKRPDLLVSAINSWASNLSQKVVIVFLGDGELRNVLAGMASSNVPLRFLGFRNQSELSRYYHAADLLVLPSGGETWGLVVNEALLHGVPCVVSSAVGCAPDLIVAGKTGEVFLTDDVDSLISALERSRLLIGQVAVREQCRTLMDKYSVRQAAHGIALGYERARQQGGQSVVSRLF